MEDFIAKLPTYLERMGAAGAVIFFGLWLLEKREHAKTREEKDKVQEKRIAEGLAAIAVIEKNTAETRTTATVVQTLIQTLTFNRGDRT